MWTKNFDPSPPAAIDLETKEPCPRCGSHEGILAENARVARAGADRVRCVVVGLHLRCETCWELTWQGVAVWGASVFYGRHTLLNGCRRVGHVPKPEVAEVTLRHSDAALIECTARIVVRCGCGDLLADTVLVTRLVVAEFSAMVDVPETLKVGLA